MHFRTSLLMIGHFLLVMAFLITPVVDNLHAVKMLGSDSSDLQTTASAAQKNLAMSKSAPCHEAAPVSIAHVLPADINDKTPCCPYDECSPDNCLMHMAMASLNSVEMIPQAPLDQRTFLLIDITPVALPFTERLRPPIARVCIRALLTMPSLLHSATLKR